MSAPRRSACATASADFAATSGFPEPRLIMYVAWMKTGSSAARSRASSPRSPGPAAQPRGLDTKTWMTSAPTSAA